MVSVAYNSFIIFYLSLTFYYLADVDFGQDELSCTHTNKPNYSDNYKNINQLPEQVTFDSANVPERQAAPPPTASLDLKQAPADQDKGQMTWAWSYWSEE